jgi:hypothetical protein
MASAMAMAALEYPSPGRSGGNAREQASGQAFGMVGDPILG